MKILGQRIRYCRKLLGMTQSELAAPEFTKAYISMVESGEATPSIKTLLILAERLHQRPGYFLEEDAEPDYEAIVEALKKRNQVS